MLPESWMDPLFIPPAVQQQYRLLSVLRQTGARVAGKQRLEDGAKMVARRVDTKPAEAIP
jgi:hypothetical protein